MSKNKRIIITGASGFIGHPCVQQLIHLGYEVHAVSGKQRESTNNVIWHQVDILNAQAVSDLCDQVCASHLLHLAWYVEPGYKTSIENIHWITASMHLLKAFHNNGGQRAVFAGTCFEYDLNGGVLFEDRTPKGPHTVYGASKHTLQELVRNYAETSDLSVAWTRVFYLYGPRENPQRLLSSVVNALLKGERAACSEGRQVLDFLHVDDVASALVAVLQSSARGAVNIGSGIPVSVRELVYTTASLLSALDRVDFGARPMPANEPLVIVANTDRLNNEIGWSPTFSLETGLANTIEWWRETLPNDEDVKL